MLSVLSVQNMSFALNGCRATAQAALLRDRHGQARACGKAGLAREAQPFLQGKAVGCLDV
jgi:hypothetical protein